jgi:signal transduction histidine kinase
MTAESPGSESTSHIVEPAAICPRCRNAVGPRDVTCAGCGADLVLSSALAERLAISSVPAEPGLPYVGDMMLPRFGEFLISHGYITDVQLQDALSRQREQSGAGGRSTLGQVLLELGVMTRLQLEVASVEQVQELQGVLRQMNAQLEQRVADRTRELREAYQKLAELDRLKGNFIANVSHELRTPLTKIKGFNTLLAGGDLGPLTPEQNQALEVMGRGIGELERLIADLIQFASGTRGEMLLRRSAFSVADLMEWAVANHSERAVKRGIGVEVLAPPGLARVVADPEKIRWVLNQLLDNALKFTPAGGTVRFSAVQEGERMVVGVEDTGAGIAGDRLSELFEPFHQLDGSSTRRQGGAGLGLALVKLILEAHDSAIRVSSEPSVGSRFWFELPVEPATQPS